MTSITFTTSEQVKAEFVNTFRGQNKGRLLTRLMAEAVEQEQRRQRHRLFFLGLFGRFC